MPRDRRRTWARRDGGEQLKAILSDWPIKRPADCVKLVNQAMKEKEAQAIGTYIARKRPSGSDAWQAEQARRLGLEHTLCSDEPPKGRGRTRRSNNKLRPSFDFGCDDAWMSPLVSTYGLDMGSGEPARRVRSVVEG